MTDTVPTNGRPGWRDVLHAVETSEQRLTKRIDRNRELIEQVDKRVELLESESITSAAERRTAVKIAAFAKTVIGGIAGAVLAILGLGFLG